MRSVYRELRWAAANEGKEGGVLETFMYENEHGTACYRFIRREAGCVDGIGYFDIGSYRGAAGPYIDTLPEYFDAFFSAFQSAFESYCVQQHIIAEFAKLDPWDTYHEKIAGFYDAKYYGNFYCINLTRDFYKETFNRRAKRSIRKAEAAGAVVSFDHKGDTIGRFIELYHNTEDKFSASEYYRMSEENIRNIFKIFGEDAFLCNVTCDGKIITSVLSIMGEDIVHYLLLGSDPQYAALQPNSLLTYKTALYAAEKGRQLLDMGGSIPGGGVEQFKRNFISEEDVYPYYAVKKIHNQQIYQHLVEKRREIRNPNFFPLYRG